MAEEQKEFGDEECGGAQKTRCQGSIAIPALADEEMFGEDDEYDDLYNDVNVGEGFLQLQKSVAPPRPGSMGSTGLQVQKNEAPEPGGEAGGSQGQNIPGISVQGKHPNVTASYPVQEGQAAHNRSEIGSGSYPSGSTISQEGNVMEVVTRDTQVKNMGFQVLTSASQKAQTEPSGVPQKIANDPAQSLNSVTVGPQGAQQVPPNQMGMNVNHPLMNENRAQLPIGNGPTMLFVGELHWWTTDAELESVLSRYGRVKEIKFFDERASGKSKGYCQVEFYDSASAAACKEGMNGYIFNGRACVVAFASPQTLKQMGASYMNKNQGQTQAQPQGMRPNDGLGRGGNMNYQNGDAGRSYGRGGRGRGGQGVVSRGGGSMRGRGAVGVKNMGGSSAGVGNGANGAGAHGQGLAGPAFGGPAGGMMHPQGMMGAGFDPTYMGRGGGYQGFPGPGFPGMLPSFPAVNMMGLAGVAPHVNPAFFGHGMAPNGMGLMGSSGMDGPHAGMWTDTSMGGWGGDEYGRRTRESSYGGEDGASEFGYGNANRERGRPSSASREKKQVSEPEWSGNSDRRQRVEKERDWDRSERGHREHRYREEKDSSREHRHPERDLDYNDEWDRGQSSSRSRSRSHAKPEEERRSRSRDVDYGKKRR